MVGAGCAMLAAACLTSMAAAQTSWWRTCGETNSDYRYSVQQTADGEYITVGWESTLGAGTPDSANVYLNRPDAASDTPWTRTYCGPTGDCRFSVRQTSDGGVHNLRQH